MLQFWQTNYMSELAYSSEIPQGQVIGVAFEVAASETKRIEEAALVLRGTIRDAHKETLLCLVHYQKISYMEKISKYQLLYKNCVDSWRENSWC